MYGFAKTTIVAMAIMADFFCDSQTLANRSVNG